MPPKAKPAAPVRRPYTVASVAAHHQVARIAQPSLDPADVVVQRHPVMRHYDCIAINGVHCAESVLRLALSLTQFDAAKKSLDNGALPSLDVLLEAPPLQANVALDDATIPYVRRRLARLRLAAFPIYVLAPVNDHEEPEFVLISGIPREDNWAIIYLPQSFFVAWPYRPAHWTFSTVAYTPPVKTCVTAPTIVYSDMPITDQSPQIYWRCRPTTANMTQYVAMRSQGRACHCCQKLICPHEYAFRQKYPNARHLLLEGHMVFDGQWRAQVIESTEMDGHQVICGSRGVVDVVSPSGYLSSHEAMHDHPSVRRSACEIFGSMEPWGAASWCYEAGIIGWFPLPVRLMMRVTMRIGSTFSERWWPFFYWKYDIPEEEEETEIRPYRLRMSRLSRRRARPWLLCVQGLVRLGIACFLAWLAWKQIPKIIAILDEFPRVLDHKRGPINWYQRGPNGWIQWWRRAPEITEEDLSNAVEVGVETLREVKAEMSPFRFIPRLLNPVVDYTIDRLSEFAEIVNFAVLRPFYGAAWQLFYGRRSRLDQFIDRLEELRHLAQERGGVLRDCLVEIHRRAYPRIQPYFKYGIAAVKLHFYTTRAYRMASSGAIYILAATGAVGTSHFPVPAQAVMAKRQHGDVTGTRLASFEKLGETNSRLAVRRERPADICTDTFRRAQNECRWKEGVTPQEFELWLSTVVNVPGYTPSIPENHPSECITCFSRQGKRHHGECRECKRKRTHITPEPLLGEPLMVYVGRVGLWSRKFTLPKVELKAEASVSYRVAGRKRYLRDYDAIMERMRKHGIEVTCRGWNSGPMIDGNIPMCFPRGEAVAVMAFVVRLGAKRLHDAEQRPWRLVATYLRRRARPLQAETREQFLAHFRGKKRAKMEEAFANIDAGYAVEIPEPKSGDPPIAKMKGFPKAEKSFSYTMKECSFEKKETEKPRFICCPNPEFLAEIGQYTHPQLKWLSEAFPYTSHCFYAGCATPEQMNEWLNWTLRELPEAVSIVDDITAIDSNHNAWSFWMHKAVRREHYPRIPDRIEMLYRSEENITIRVGMYTLRVELVNASGVPDTSYKNGAPCLVLRPLAILYAVTDFDSLTDVEVLQRLDQLLRTIFTSAAGDDGLTRTPRVIMGVDVMSPHFRQRYEEWWARAGFTVKVDILPEHRWRMATYLAMRPVWAGDEYQWAPEPARRLKSLFWQIDNAMHPTAWARGVATQTLQQGRHCPVLADICSWFLSKTKGPVATPEEKMYSPWHHYVTTGRMNDRAIREFCEDYHVSRQEIEFMRHLLDRTHSVFVNIGCSVVRRVMLEES